MHEPECPQWMLDYIDAPPDAPRKPACICVRLRTAYQRGWSDRDDIRYGKRDYQLGYRDGYNDHAESRAHAEQMYGPYTGLTVKQVREIEGFNQHGEGENP